MLLRSSPSTTDPALDLTPIIDMVFLLLIFFLAATSFQQIERELSIALPEARAAGPISAALREIVINVQADGGAVVAGQPVDDDALSKLIVSRLAANPQQKVSVRGDRSTAYANVARVLDVCRASGISTPVLETVPVG